VRKIFADLKILLIGVNYHFLTKSDSDRPYGPTTQLTLLLATVVTKLESFQMKWKIEVAKCVDVNIRTKFVTKHKINESKTQRH